MRVLVTGGTGLIGRELTGELIDNGGRPSFFRVPGFVLRGLLGEAATLVLDGQRVKPEALLDRGFEFRYPELSRALEDLLGEEPR
ncbi:MAG: DUF1731 domain-containing protein [Candidatus Acetothermia bacterium]